MKNRLIIAAMLLQVVPLLSMEGPQPLVAQAPVRFTSIIHPDDESDFRDGIIAFKGRLADETINHDAEWIKFEQDYCKKGLIVMPSSPYGEYQITALCTPEQKIVVDRMYYNGVSYRRHYKVFCCMEAFRKKGLYPRSYKAIWNSLIEKLESANTSEHDKSALQAFRALYEHNVQLSPYGLVIYLAFHMCQKHMPTIKLINEIYIESKLSFDSSCKMLCNYPFPKEAL
jgi:hypothetical protein